MSLAADKATPAAVANGNGSSVGNGNGKVVALDDTPTSPASPQDEFHDDEFHDAQEGAAEADAKGTTAAAQGEEGLVRAPDSALEEAKKFEDGKELDYKSKLRSFFNVLRKFIGVKDLSAVQFSLPAQLIEPVSNLEDWIYIDRPDLFTTIADYDDPADRMLAALRFWQSKDLRFAKGKVAKPLNPVLGEVFRCTYGVPIQTQSETGAILLKPSTEKAKTTELVPPSTEAKGQATVGVIVEQISHHPPVSAYVYACPEKGIEACGIDQISARFGGTSVKVYPGELNKGIYLTLSKRNEQYHLTHPTANIGGFLRGAPTVTVSGRSYLTCPESKIKVIIQYIDERILGKPRFLLEGIMFTYDPEKDTIETLKEVPEEAKLATIKGSWRGVMTYTKKGEKEKTLIDFEQLEPVEKTLRPDSEQAQNESRQVWGKVMKLMKTGKYSDATRGKIEIEEKQRGIAKERKRTGAAFKSAFFIEPVVDGRPSLNDAGKAELAKDIKQASTTTSA